MKSLRLPVLLLIFLLDAAAQITLNPAPTRVLGQASTTLSSINPNLVEGRELLVPQAIAIDSTTSPASLYVADTGNNRVLGYRNAAFFTPGQKADIVIGQLDFAATLPAGPSQTSRTTGLWVPQGLVVDSSGNLYVADVGNNRILRYHQPLLQTATVLPDMVIGQPDFTTGAANQGGRSASSLSLTGIQTSLALDASGNLWVTDPGNNRILRFPAAVLGASAKSGPAADLVLGQGNFTANSGGAPVTSFSSITAPSGLAFDSGGRLFASEAVANQRGRVLVWSPPFSNGQLAAKMLGVYTGTPAPPLISQYEFQQRPAGMFAFGAQIGVADTFNSRILLFPPFDQWNSNTFYQAAITVIGQPDFSSGFANQGGVSPTGSTLIQPVGVVFFNNSLYVADTGNNRVVLLPKNGLAFDPATSILGQLQPTLNSPNLIEGREFNFSSKADAGLAIDFTSAVPHLYVADTANNRILGFYDLRNFQAGQHADIVIGQPDFLHAIANYPDGLPSSGNLSGPTGLTVDASGNLYVADTDNGRVLRFRQPFANFQPGTPLAFTASADLLLGQISFTTKITDPTSQTMSQPYGVVFAGEFGLFVSDKATNRVLYFRGRSQDLKSSQAAQTVFGQSDMTSSGAGSGLNRMNSPHHIATDTNDRLYVADSGNGRILIFNSAPTAGNGAFAAITLTNGLKTPRGVDVNPVSGEIWVADGAANAAVRYPKFDTLIGSGTLNPDATLVDYVPLAVVEDAWGNIFLADNANRVLIFYPGLSALNAANYLGLQTNPPRPLAPGLITALYSTGGAGQFGTGSAAATAIPLPKMLNGIQVLVNNTPSPLFYAGPDQINFVVPSNAPQSGTADILVLESETGRVLGNTTVIMDTVSPGVFTQKASGSGDGVIANEDGTLNTPANPAKAGSVVTIYLTGQGYISGMPPDGEIPNAALSTPYPPSVYIGSQFFVPPENVLYSGLAPTLVGVWQINVRIPKEVISTPSSPVQVFIQAGGWASGGLGLGRPVYAYVKAP